MANSSSKQSTPACQLIIGSVSHDALAIVIQVHSFQVILSTDGKASFAIFLYEDPSVISTLPAVQIGFNAGDREHMANIPINSTQETNVYRIDGMSPQFLVGVNM